MTITASADTALVDAASVDTDVAVDRRTDLRDRFVEMRAMTGRLAARLSIEDQVVQSMPDASPTKWHLGHTTWFFETFVTQPDERFDEQFAYLFNSYYETIGRRQPRAERGLLTRPAHQRVIDYRAAIDDSVVGLLDGDPTSAQLDLVELGIHHEQQHQELILMDALHLLSQHPFAPAYSDAAVAASSARRRGWMQFDEGLSHVGHEGDGFAFDNEGPRHRVWLDGFEMADDLVTCGEWRQFIADGGYDEATLWLSEGWAWRLRTGQQAPILWDVQGGTQFDLHGEHPIDDHQPVSHLTYYEADAFARWAGARLPREAEWETAFGADDPTVGQFCDEEVFHPVAPAAPHTGAMGTLWEWTSSSYDAYPGFTAAAGAVGEYNGKFMANQYVLRGGSHMTPPNHVRATYRNFFPTHTSWHASGVRLCRDAT